MMVFSRRQRHFLLLSVMMVALVVSAGETTAAREQNVLRLAHPHEIYHGKQGNLDPTSAARFAPPIVMLYDQLLLQNADGTLYPGLAESWESDETGRIFTLTLRKNVRFHNGRPLTASDVVYTFQHILNPDARSPLASVLNTIDPQAFETPDDHTVKIHLKEPHFVFPLTLTHYMLRIIPADSAGTIGKTGIGTGPFQLQTFDYDGTTVLVANQDYWGGTPQLDAIHVLAIDDKNSEVYELLDGQLDYVDRLSSFHVQLFQNDDNFTLQEMPTGSWHALVMNTTVAPFSDLRVRSAMKRVVDRRKMIDLVLRGHGMVAHDHPVWSQDPFYLKLERPQNFEHVRALLSEAGYPEGLDVELTVADVNAYMVPMAVAYKDMAAKAGIRVTIKLATAGAYWSEHWMKTPFCGTRWTERPADLILNEAFRSGAKWNETFWNHAQFDQLLTDARKEPDVQKRKALYHKAQQLVVAESGYIIPFFESTVSAWSSRVRGISSDVSKFRIDWARVSKDVP